VNSQRFPFRINVGFLRNEPLGSFRDIHFQFDEIQLSPDFIVKDLSGGAHISRTPQGLIFECKFQATSTLECVRCLEPFEQVLNAEFSEVFSYKNIEFTESSLLVPEDGNIDLDPLVREYLLLDSPIKPLCKPDCLDVHGLW
jgi:uncharacterized protein